MTWIVCAEKWRQSKNSMNTRKTGAEYEEQAAQYLRKEGYQILERNYKSRFGEIDILADKDGELLLSR